MGDRRKQAPRVQFDGKIKLRFHGAKITSDAGLLAFRELDEAFRLTEQGSTVLSDPRQGRNTQHTMLARLRKGVYGRGTAEQWIKQGIRGRIGTMERPRSHESRQERSFSLESSGSSGARWRLEI